MLLFEHSDLKGKHSTFSPSQPSFFNYDPEEFVRLCAQALAEDRTWVLSRRRDYGQAASWNNRSAEVSRILSTAGLL